MASQQYRFHEIAPLSHLPNPTSARTVLDRLASDPAILHVMGKHQFSVGTLTELAPHEQPHLLGLNVNAGQAIKLRLRTDAYDGFRPYAEVRRVLCHELSHNLWGDHDNNVRFVPFCVASPVLMHDDSSRSSTLNSTARSPNSREPPWRVRISSQIRAARTSQTSREMRRSFPVAGRTF